MTTRPLHLGRERLRRAMVRLPGPPAPSTSRRLAADSRRLPDRSTPAGPTVVPGQVDAHKSPNDSEPTPGGPQLLSARSG